MRMRIGSRWWRFAIASMRGGMVAEKSTVWRSGGRFLEDRLDVLGEAHVEHLVGLVEHDDAHAAQLRGCRGGCGRARGPGVATTTSTPARSAWSWRPIGWPP